MLKFSKGGRAVPVIVEAGKGSIGYGGRRRPALHDDGIMAPIVAGGRATGVLALRRDGSFDPGAGRWLARACRKLAHEMALREERRANRIVDQIKDKTVRELRPKD